MLDEIDAPLFVPSSLHAKCHHTVDDPLATWHEAFDHDHLAQFGRRLSNTLPSTARAAGSIMPSPTDDETPFPSLSRSSTLNGFGRSHLSPDDAFVSPPRRPYNLDGAVESIPRGRRLDGERSRSRRRKRAWKKLMWVKQSCRLRSRPNTTCGN